jgi:hypothetical protein
MKSLLQSQGRSKSMVSELFSKNNGNLRKGGFIMKATRFIQLASGLTLIVVLLSACGGGGSDSTFSITSDGFDFQFSEPEFFDQETYRTELPLVDHMKIRLEAVRGDIQIEGQDDVNSVTVIAQKQVGSDSLSDAETHMDELKVLITDEIDKIVIQTSHPPNTQRRKYIVDYHIIVPSDLETEVALNIGHVSILDVQNSVSVDATTGGVFLSNIAASVLVSLFNGSIDGTVALPLDGKMILSTHNGDIDLDIPMSTSAEFTASVTNGWIADYNLAFDAAVQTTQRLTGTLGSGEGVIDLDVINGNITVAGVN